MDILQREQLDKDSTDALKQLQNACTTTKQMYWLGQHKLIGFQNTQPNMYSVEVKRWLNRVQ
jgi:hypothetical protein